ncbi:protein DEHYDRATION-INDUCED 19 homolog 5-like [Macadamia integrifolia]|uniref:protein DEHYDRATION-INDUCED 19 homolog 5-like n=1 Tax=Macadamia integrifolia TaxID=60698 RepID=UPI001C4EA690|nr:protein DEHYDRATION-INDUCED 19 homolog 5-like [Macadamia integrifolia]
MDIDFWASRVDSAKHLTAMQAARLSSENHLRMDDYEGDDDVRACFPCPFCYLEIEVPVLCAHLREEHCFDVKNAVCPVCAEILGKDMIGHFTVQHAHLLKRRRKSQRSGVWNNSSVMLGKELRELSSFLGAASTNGRGSATDYVPDPLLSPFLCSIVIPDTNGDQDKHSKNDLSASSDMKSMEPSASDKTQEQDFGERNQRAEFFQQLVLSTIL